MMMYYVYVRLYHRDEDFLFGEYHYHMSRKVNMNNVHCKSWECRDVEKSYKR